VAVKADHRHPLERDLLGGDVVDVGDDQLDLLELELVGAPGGDRVPGGGQALAHLAREHEIRHDRDDVGH
jgi:hypothetical protein